MPRFCAPSSSAASAPSTPPRSTRTQSKKATSHRVHAHKLDKAKAAVKEATKRANKSKQLVEPCIVYVGNIGPDVDEKALVAHFSRYGRILSARISCCGGVAMTITPPPASYHQNMRVRQYAMVFFESKAAKRAACKRENILDGQKLIVSTSVSDLPEVQEKVSKRLENYRSRLEPPDVRRARQSALKSLKLEPTVLLDPVYGKERKLRRRFQWMGYSFQEGIM